MTYVKDIFGSDLFSQFVGYDSLVKRMSEVHDGLAKNIPGYPPYNIRKTAENKYVIELAVAGVSKNDIEITMEDGTLKIAGKSKSEDDSASYLHKGIAERAFSRSFSLADSVEVKNAEMINGMLKIWLEAIVPENKKARKININEKGTNEKEFLRE